MIDREVADRKLTQEQRDLVWRYWPFALTCAYKFSRHLSTRKLTSQFRIEINDWAIEYLFDRARTYRAKDCPNFATYYAANVYRHLYRNVGYFMDAVYSGECLHYDSLEDKSMTAIKHFEDCEYLDTVYHKSNVTDDERAYLQRWATSDSHNAMAAELDVSPQAVQQRVKKIIGKIRQVVTD